MNAITVTMKMLIRNHLHFILVTPLTISNLSHIALNIPLTAQSFWIKYFGTIQILPQN
jgi:hypothetical protein